jgi:hypothetical protein
LSEAEPANAGLREAVAGNFYAGNCEVGGAFQSAGGPLTWFALGGRDGGFAMRSMLLAFLFAALTAASASACAYHMTMAVGDQAQPAQTAQAQPAPAQYE